MINKKAFVSEGFFYLARLTLKNKRQALRASRVIKMLKKVVMVAMCLLRNNPT